MKNNKCKMPRHVERLRDEKNKLNAQIRKLERLIDADVPPDTVKPQEIAVLERQIWAMDALSQIYAERIALWKGKANE